MLINKVTTKIKYINCCSHQFYSTNVHNTIDHASYKDKIKRKEIIQHHLDLSYLQTAMMIRKNAYLQNIDNSKLTATLYALEKMGITKTDIIKNPTILTLHYNSIEHHVMYLKEAGFKDMSAGFLLRFRNAVKKPVALLKAHGIIDEDINVPNRLYSYLIPKPLRFPLLDELNDEHSIVHMHTEIFKHYLVWRLDTSEQEINRIFKTYDKFKYRSFKLMSDMLRLLTKEFKFTEKKLLQQSYLFQVNPQYPFQILNLYPKIAGTDVKQILKKYPKIIAVPPESITAILDYLKSFEVSDESISNCFGIFTLSPDTVLFRLNQIKNVPEFAALKNNRRFVRLLFNYNKAKLRLDYLQKIKVKNTSLHLLIVSDKHFEKFVNEGYETNRGTDVLNYLSNVLNMPIAKLRELINHNSHWCQVPLVNIQDSLTYLEDKKFPYEEIQKLPVILLYSRNAIEEALLEMELHPELCNLVLNNREQLNLCLYFIEKKYHFSGDGVWEDKVEIKPKINDAIAEDILLLEPEKTIEKIKEETLC